MAMRPGLRALYERDLRLCWICGYFVNEDEASRDHIIPRSHGGTRAMSNLRLAHKRCNAQRGNGPATTPDGLPIRLPAPRPPRRRRRSKVCPTCNSPLRECGCTKRPVLRHITNENAQTFMEKLSAQKQDEDYWLAVKPR